MVVFMEVAVGGDLLVGMWWLVAVVAVGGSSL
jgi:hypothetical protein